MPIGAETAVPNAVSVDCPAKINLHLRIGPPRADGFHPLMSWMTTVGLFDTLTMQLCGAGVPPAAGETPTPQSLIDLTCDPPIVPNDDRNLVVRMIKAWAQRRSDAGQAAVAGIRATLLKRTPAGAGLGGGSSDAACALLAAERLIAGEPPLTTDQMAEIAATLGSDIPFFFSAPSAVCTGRGEIVRPIAPPAAKWAVLILPPIHMPTPDVYRKFDAMGLGRQKDVETEPDWAAWAKLPAAKLMTMLVNDLEAPAFAIRPELEAIRLKAERKSVRPVRMSGSGSSLFTLFGDERTATEVRDYLRIHLREFGIEEQAVMVVGVGVPIIPSSA
ncbi:4-(cytidine 5'-diphospho)-2-C-methyl-D-erythritol kinase [Humisphaera borealis]|uniref:4-diphosphocytidyl-2-C-methyl-D-erythritol kinase n=1 Tax=Humisphaera borealis TaxID=2807512 RepID=A0A7M2X374_9BACT|nr:4-(cytidine 5'-diphospho)-2-C-methyl-D-erythritol kinase [Humisphaera borealis]QOV92208.1 4-(cytidine 5'-diphospho)-2-C-methyl-D-erythritol kinase [Humisphaera borealis]